MGSHKEWASTPIAVPPVGTKERRSVCRYSVIQSEAWIGWWAGTEFQSTPTRIVDISLRGALLTVDTFPPKDLDLFFCPPGTSANDEWLEVKMISTKKRLFGPREVRISFRKIFPYEVFKSVVYGSDVCRPSDHVNSIPPDSEDRDWW